MDTMKLCFVRDSWAYFTSLPITEQAGDDWDDAPYEHNAGPPYAPRRGEDYRVVKVAFDGDLVTPSWGRQPNSPYSVDQINAGAIPWLRAYNGLVAIPAGTTLVDFDRLVRDAGGRVYYAREDTE